MSEIITGLIPSAPRRVFSSAVLYLLGAMLLSIAVVQPPEDPGLIFVLLLVGGIAVWGGWKLWQATGRMIELTEESLRLSDGTVIARIADIHKVDRSFFAFKPSNGFLITLNTRYPFAWKPGLWWRIGKRVGVGGVTSGAQTKVMADTISAMLAVRDGQIDGGT